MPQLIILIPIYKETLNELELFSLNHSFSKLNKGREIRFLAPSTLDIGYYNENFLEVGVDFYPEEYFKSTDEYSRLLLSSFFYENYLKYKYLLIHQTDAILLHDNLDYWCSLDLSYVGAPWPAGLDVVLNRSRFNHPNEKNIKIHVGNGGFSLRNISDFIDLLKEYQEEVSDYIRNGFDDIGGRNEDVFYAAMAIVSNDFSIPDPVTASIFATEYPPGYYMQYNGNKTPMAGHAWWKFDIEFWRRIIEN